MKRSELVFTRDISGTFSSYLDKDTRQAIIIADNTTKTACLPLLRHSFPVISFPPGELSKNLNNLQMVLDGLLVHKADKNTLIINLGGGVVTDMGGFAASIFKRGLDYINIPTTLLGMVDAAIGGKTGVDFHSYKNYLGTFYAPEAVLISEQFLDTLPKIELDNGWAEIVKTAVIADPELVQMIKSGKNFLGDIIASVSATKQRICDEDPFDGNVRQLLNFGHTIGHAYETCRIDNNDPVMHGMAVARGMLYETGLAARLGMLSVDDGEFISNLIREQTKSPDLTEAEFNSLLPFLQGDKKNSGTGITFSLPTGIGTGAYGVKVDMADLKI
jgi:3-dehydroquinate synthase